MAVINIFSHYEKHTTARYFERTARDDDEATVLYWDRCPDVGKFGQEDMPPNQPPELLIL